MKRVLIWIFVIALVGSGIGAVVWFRNREAEQSTGQDVLRTGDVVREDLVITVASSGSVVMRQSADLSFETPGTVRSVSVSVGERVKAGQELARLDDTSLRDAIRRAELDLAQVELNLETLLEPVDDAEIALAELAVREAAMAMTVARSSEELAEARAAQDTARAARIEDDTRDDNVEITEVKNEYAIEQSRSQWFSAYERYEKAQWQVEQLKSGVDENQIRTLELQIEQAQLSLEQAQANLASVILLAPFDGVISAVNVRVDTAAPTGLPAFTLIDDRDLYVNLSVDEIDIGGLEEGQPAAVTLDAYTDVTLEGIVDRIAALPESLGGVIVYPVRVRITDVASTDPRDGMTASATITLGRLEDVLLIPNWAVRTNQSSVEVYTYCYCGEEGQLQPTPIEVGARNETWTQVVSGLEEGMQVALVAETRNILELQGPPSDGRD